MPIPKRPSVPAAKQEEEATKKPEEETAAAAAAEKPDPYASLVKTNEGIAGTLDAVSRRLAAMSQLDRPAPGPAQETIDDVTDAEIEAELGPAAVKIIRKAQGAAQKRAQQAMNGRIGALEEYGVNAISKINSRIVTEKLPYMELVKADMEQVLQGIADPAARATEEAITYAYNIAVAKNTPKIVRLEIEQALRGRDGDEAQTQDVGSGAGGRAARATGGGDKNPEGWDDVFGEEQMKALKLRGLTPDQFAQKLNYENAEEYVRLNNHLKTIGQA